MRSGSSKEPLRSSGMLAAQRDPETRRNENINADILIVRHSEQNRLDITIPPLQSWRERKLDKTEHLRRCFYCYEDCLFCFKHQYELNAGPTCYLNVVQVCSRVKISTANGSNQLLVPQVSAEIRTPSDMRISCSAGSKTFSYFSKITQKGRKSSLSDCLYGGRLSDRDGTMAADPLPHRKRPFTVLSGHPN